MEFSLRSKKDLCEDVLSEEIKNSRPTRKKEKNKDRSRHENVWIGVYIKKEEGGKQKKKKKVYIHMIRYYRLYVYLKQKLFQLQPAVSGKKQLRASARERMYQGVS